jgi:hypothetical protein
MPTQVQRVLAYVLLSLIVGASFAAQPALAVVFPDKNLEAAVRSMVFE